MSPQVDLRLCLNWWRWTCTKPSRAREPLFRNTESSKWFTRCWKPLSTCTVMEFTTGTSSPKTFWFPTTLSSWLTLDPAEASTQNLRSRSTFQLDGIVRLNVCWQTGTITTKWTIGASVAYSSKSSPWLLCFQEPTSSTRCIRSTTLSALLPRSCWISFRK